MFKYFNAKGHIFVKKGLKTLDIFKTRKFINANFYAYYIFNMTKINIVYRTL